MQAQNLWGVITGRRRPLRRSTAEAMEGLLFVSPWALGFLILTFGPMVASLGLSFTRYSIVRPPEFLGIGNYVRAFSGADRLFYSSLVRTAYFVLFFVPLGISISFTLAMLLNRPMKGTSIYRTLFFLPSLTPAAAATLLWIWLLNPEVGAVNFALLRLGIQGPRWLASPQWALPSVVMIAVWASAGGSQMIIFLAGLQGVPEELYDAANIDGANAWRRFVNVTLPMVSPVIFFNMILSAIGAWRVFTVAFMGTGGGPAYATWFYMLHLYTTAFRSLHMGYGSSLAWVLFAIVMSITIFQFQLSRSWVYYAGEITEGGA